MLDSDVVVAAAVVVGMTGGIATTCVGGIGTSVGTV